MQLKGEALIRASRETVWAALNDPAVLARCIDGVESLEPDGDNRFRGTLDARVGPVRAKFSGTVSLTEIDPPNRYVLVGEGKGGVAGFARGSAEVTLHDAEGSTRLAYAATSQVGGKLAQLGARLVEGAARGYAESFFERFRELVEAPAVEAGTGPEAPPPASTAPAPTPAARGIAPFIWAGALLLLVAVLLFLLVRQG